jgi:hypothetical protein
MTKIICNFNESDKIMQSICQDYYKKLWNDIALQLADQLEYGDINPPIAFYIKNQDLYSSARVELSPVHREWLYTVHLCVFSEYKGENVERQPNEPLYILFEEQCKQLLDYAEKIKKEKNDLSRNM